MEDATVAFLEGLSGRGVEPLLGGLTAKVRIDLEDGDATDHWLLDVRRGVIDVAHGDGEADSTLRADRATFEELATGRTNAMAAALRGALRIEGDLRILVLIQRLFPAPVGMPKAAGNRSVGRSRS